MIRLKMIVSRGRIFKMSYTWSGPSYPNLADPVWGYLGHPLKRVLNHSRPTNAIYFALRTTSVTFSEHNDISRLPMLLPIVQT